MQQRFNNLLVKMLVAVVLLQSPLALAGVLVENSFSEQSIISAVSANGYGINNLKLHADSGGNYIRVHYPKGSMDPGSYFKRISPLGGAGVVISTKPVVGDEVWLSYEVRLPKSFPFVLGGKLPGLAGGVANTGGSIPDGEDGFSARLMWRKEGKGEIYAYLPTSQTWGSSLGTGSWSFTRGKWVKIKQMVRLNTPGISDGGIKLYINDHLVFSSGSVRFRDAPSLTVDKVYFETFFGGHEKEWAAPYDTYLDVRKFRVWLYK